MEEYICGGELVMKSLAKEGVNIGFGLVGNPISPMLVYASKYGIRFISVRHELNAIHMADGWAQKSRKPGIVFVTTGPGFTNTYSGIIKAYKAGTPLIIITASISQMNRDKGALQDIEQLTPIKNYTKWCKTIYEVSRIPEYIVRALNIANTGKRGPVVLEIPVNLLQQMVNTNSLIQYKNCKNTFESESESNGIKQFFKELQHSKKTIMVIGEESYYDEAYNEIRKLLQKIEMPVVLLNKARGIIADDNSYCLGSARTLDGGMAIEIYAECDLIIAIGLNADYQLGTLRKPVINSNCKIICINNSSYETLVAGFEAEILLCGNIKNTLNRILNFCYDNSIVISINVMWNNRWKKQKTEFYNSLKESYNNLNFRSYDVINEIKKHLTPDTTIVIDGSNAMFWASILFNITVPGTLIVAPDGQLGAIGAGLSMAIGAKLANPKSKVILYSGDGSFGFGLVELDTIKRYGIKLEIFIHNDSSWGVCKSSQNSLYQKEEAVDIKNTRYDLISEAFGNKGVLIQNLEELFNALSKYKKTDETICYNMIMHTNEYSPGSIKYIEALHNSKQT